ncbi:MAG: IclR family transcriptional regulator [Clostridia bacterium]|nr:IclR family transcriptional regulator [Clostridia bacterium]
MQSVDRITNIIHVLSQENRGLSISEISNKTDLSPSTVHRLLKSLQDKNYVVQDDESKKYKLGLEILRVAIHLLNNNNVVNIARKHNESLAEKCKKMVFLSVIENDRVICVDTATTIKSTSQFYVRIGSEMPINASASAKAIIAYQDDDYIRKLLNKNELKKYMDRTKVDCEEIMKEYKEIANEGLAICDEEMEVGVQAIASPIRDYRGNVIASVSIILTKSNNVIEKDIIESVKACSDQISQELGFIIVKR